MTITIRLHCEDMGGGRPVVLLHGYPLNSGIWREQQKALAGLYRVITPDLRGHGKSMAPAGIYDMDTMAADVLRLLDELELDNPVLMGHSMGGYVALAAYRAQPRRFAALGLIASQATADTQERRDIRLSTVEQVLQAGEGGTKIIRDQMLPELFAPGVEQDPEMVDDVGKMILGASPTGIVGILKGMALRPDSTPLLPEMTLPVLLLAGDKDQIISPTRSEAMSAVLPNATHIVIEDAGHMLMLEQPGATSEALRQFLSSLDT